MLNNNIIEIWRPIPNFENYYEASNTGFIRTLRTKKVLKTYTINSGYKCLKFTVNGERSSHLVHRLIAITFIPNTEEKATVNHIDGNKQNNCLSNLEWHSYSENCLHAYKLDLHSLEDCKSYIGKLHAKTHSKYHNVGFDKSRNKYYGKVVHNAKVYDFKRFDSEIEAALHVNNIIDKYGFDRPKNIIEMPNDYPAKE